MPLAGIKPIDRRSFFPAGMPAFRSPRRRAMLYRSLIGTIVSAALAMAAGDARALDDAKYPDWTGQWERFVVPGLGGQPSFDQTKPWGFGQQAPPDAGI